MLYCLFRVYLLQEQKGIAEVHAGSIRASHVLAEILSDEDLKEKSAHFI
jgi:hypothetical protein